jgi:hypothetical protein
METTIVIIIFVVVYVGIILSAFVFLAGAIDSYIKKKKLSKFKQDIIKSIKNIQPTWNQINLIAETRKLTKAEVGKIIKELISDALTENDETLKSNLSLLESYISFYKNEEPFDDLPDDVRLHLERLKEHLPDRVELLEPIVNHLRDLKTVALRNRRRQKIIEIISLIVGVAGLIIGLYPLFKPK